MLSFALTSSKLVLDIATKLIKATVRMRNLEVIEDDMAVIFVVNHFTRLETLLLPYMLHKHTGKVIWSLAAAELFKGRIAAFLRSNGAISTRDPDRDTIIIRALLRGEHPWLIFPEGAMIKDKKVIDHRGMFEVYNDGKRRPPHRGAAVLALITEFYRHKLACLKERPDQAGLEGVLKRFELESLDEALEKRTVIIPVNITYFPIRAHDNVILRVARAMAKDLSPRAIEELSVEGTVLSEDTDMDVVLGEPIDVGTYLQGPQYAELMACGVHDMDALEKDPRSLFNNAARLLMLRYMKAIYSLTTVNSDHLLAGLLRRHRPGAFCERSYRARFFLCAHDLVENGHRPVHGNLSLASHCALNSDSCRRFDNFVDLAVKEGLLRKDDGGYRRVRPGGPRAGFHRVRRDEITYVIANEIEPLPDVMAAVDRAARLRGPKLLGRVRDILLAEDRQRFEREYATYYDKELSKGPEVGRPFLLAPVGRRLWTRQFRQTVAGVVLAHGYMAAPLEVRALAEYLCQHGYAVYAVRLKGHGTSPEDLAQTRWEEWYESINHGCAIIRTLTDNVILGGFSMGAGLALLAAGRKGPRVRAVFAIDAPLHLRTYMVHLVPSLVKVNALLKKIRWERAEWEYVENNPENPHINYTRNPVSGVDQLGHAMDAMRSVLGDIQAPTLLVQGSRDPLVAPESGQDIFRRVGTGRKQLLVLERARHGIINGDGAEEVFEAVRRFLESALAAEPEGAKMAPSPSRPEAPEANEALADASASGE